MKYKGLFLILIVLLALYSIIQFYDVDYIGEEIFSQTSCLEEPENEEIFCLVSEPKITKIGNFYTMDFELWRKDYENNFYEDLIVYTFLYNSSIYPDFFTRKDKIYYADVSEIYYLQLKVDGSHVLQEKDIPGNSGLDGKYVGIAHVVCKNDDKSDCETYGVYEWNQ